MIEIPDDTDRDKLTPSVEEVRAELMAGLSDVSTFAAAIRRTPRQVQNWIRAGMPTIYFGRTPFPEVSAARAWLASRRGTRPRQ
jgi:hypothetical protein